MSDYSGARNPDRINPNRATNIKVQKSAAFGSGSNTILPPIVAVMLSENGVTVELAEVVHGPPIIPALKHPG